MAGLEGPTRLSSWQVPSSVFVSKAAQVSSVLHLSWHKSGERAWLAVREPVPDPSMYMYPFGQDAVTGYSDMKS